MDDNIIRCIYDNFRLLDYMLSVIIYDTQRIIIDDIYNNL